MKKLIVILVLVAVAVGAYFFVTAREKENGETTFTTVKLTKGTLENTVSSTGTLSAIGTVEVGTQVSGTLKQVLADFNDHVKKDQLLAVLDKRVLKSAVQEARAGLMKARAQEELAQADFKRSKRLYDNKMVSEQEFVQGKTNLATAKASVISAETSLNRAETNLNYADIRSPIDGTIIQRNVEPGQTVAASFSTPTLFLVAADLSKMEIQALVDESDIGQIRLNQSVRFTVEAYPDKSFSGTVKQIRLQPSTVNNVVNYTVIVNADNPDHLLLPGMTATVDFIAQHLENILLIPNAALRFKPTEAMQSAMREQMKKRMANSGGGQRMRPGNNSGSAPPAAGNDRRRDFKMVWILGEDGKPEMSGFIPGPTDGKFTAVKQSRKLKEGIEVIVGLNQKSSNGSSQPSVRHRRLL
ncbi:MAG: efflux RND transporter periplasmic adaptor subunit [Acidobacteria bacterium CG_4_9_14_3_um_filter_49_7]|nr:MAG: efflux RND transporter periplasmic adaptor subunit [Acidobacteria bacterium CG_4_9_14_3_um_filter_49_7]